MNAEKDVALIVGRDLSPAAADLAQREGWAAHARMHPATAAEYESRMYPPRCRDCGHAHTANGCIGDPTPSDRWAGVAPASCDCATRVISPAVTDGDGAA